MEVGRDRGNSSELTVAPHTMHSRLFGRHRQAQKQCFFSICNLTVPVLFISSQVTRRDARIDSFLFLPFVVGFKSTLAAKGKPLDMSLWFRVAY